MQGAEEEIVHKMELEIGQKFLTSPSEALGRKDKLELVGESGNAGSTVVKV